MLIELEEASDPRIGEHFLVIIDLKNLENCRKLSHAFDDLLRILLARQLVQVYLHEQLVLDDQRLDQLWRDSVFAGSYGPNYAYNRDRTFEVEYYRRKRLEVVLIHVFQKVHVWRQTGSAKELVATPLLDAGDVGHGISLDVRRHDARSAGHEWHVELKHQFFELFLIQCHLQLVCHLEEFYNLIYGIHGGARKATWSRAKVAISVSLEQEIETRQVNRRLLLSFNVILHDMQWVQYTVFFWFFLRHLRVQIR